MLMFEKTKNKKMIKETGDGPDLNGTVTLKANYTKMSHFEGKNYNV